MTPTRPELVDFVKLLTWDTLVYDACPIELTYTRAGTLSGWHNVDPKTVLAGVLPGPVVLDVNRVCVRDRNDEHVHDHDSARTQARLRRPPPPS